MGINKGLDKTVQVYYTRPPINLKKSKEMKKAVSEFGPGMYLFTNWIKMMYHVEKLKESLSLQKEKASEEEEKEEAIA